MTRLIREMGFFLPPSRFQIDLNLQGMLLFGRADEESQNYPFQGRCRKRALIPFYPIKVLLLRDWEAPSIISLGLNKPSAPAPSHLPRCCRPHPSLSPLQSGCHDSSWSLTNSGVLCVKVKTHQTQKLCSSLKLQETWMGWAPMAAKPDTRLWQKVKMSPGSGCLNIHSHSSTPLSGAETGWKRHSVRIGLQKKENVSKGHSNTAS